MRPLAIDLCCGAGGWTDGLLRTGWRVIGFDTDTVATGSYMGELVLQDIRTLDGRRLAGASLIVASPPCQDFSRHDQPWTRKLNPPPPDFSILRACWRIQKECGVPMVLENVRGLQKWIGKCDVRWGSRYLWGDLPKPPDESRAKPQDKEKLPSTDVVERSRIPLPLAMWVGRVYKDRKGQ